MAQGFRARMNNFHSVLLEVLNTAQMEDLGKNPRGNQHILGVIIIITINGLGISVKTNH